MDSFSTNAVNTAEIVLHSDLDFKVCNANGNFKVKNDDYKCATGLLCQAKGQPFTGATLYDSEAI